MEYDDAIRAWAADRVGVPPTDVTDVVFDGYGMQGCETCGFGSEHGIEVRAQLRDDSGRVFEVAGPDTGGMIREISTYLNR